MGEQIGQIKERMADNGYRLTPARQAIVDALVRCEGHITADELAQQVRASAPHVGRMTVYRTLELLCELGVVRPIYQGTGAAHYILMANGSHHHTMSTTRPKFKNPRAKHDFKGRTVSITGVGAYVPAKAMTNFELEKIVDTTDEWITSRTGIKERRIAAKDEFTSDMAAKAAQRAMKAAGVTADQVDLIIVATITPDMVFPSTACLVQQKIGANRAAAFDIEAACSGFIYGLEIAQQFIMSRTYDTVVVMGAAKL